MSRVFEALRQTELEKATHGIAASTPEVTAPEVAAAAAPAPPAAVVIGGASEKQVLDLSETPLLGALPLDQSRLVALTATRSLAAEKFRLLATRLHFVSSKKKIRSVMVTSSVAGEGKSFVSANLAIAMGRRANERVLLLEGDLRRPSLAQIFGAGPLPGVSEWMVDRSPVTQYLRRVEGTNLWILPAGAAPEHPLEMLQGEAMSELMAQLRGAFDWVIVDAPPILPFADANLWSGLTDGMLLVIRQGVTPRKMLQHGMELLDSPKFLGVVVNESSNIEERYYDRYALKQ